MTTKTYEAGSRIGDRIAVIGVDDRVGLAMG
jgi:hypothetical protein